MVVPKTTERSVNFIFE